jgi:hypothetical protein
MDDTQEFTIPTNTKEPRWVRAVDLLPGNPTIVRSAVIYVKVDGHVVAAGLESERILARCRPGTIRSRSAMASRSGYPRARSSACAFTTRKRGSSKENR